MGVVVFEPNPAGIREMSSSAQYRQALMDIAQAEIDNPATVAAPKRTGFGAASIHPEAVMTAEGWVVRVSWSNAAEYMKFHEFGTRYMRATPFLRPTVEGF